MAHARTALEQRTVWVGEGHVHHAVHKREEAAFVIGFAGGEGDRPERAPMKRPQKADELRAARMIPRQLNRGFHALGAGIGHKTTGRTLPRHERIQFFAQRNPFVVIKIG